LFERFTERARQVVVYAQGEARSLKHDYIGTEHLLLGLLREEEGIAARVLEGFNVTYDGVRAQVERIVGQGDELASGQIPFTPRAKKVLELALREAMALQSSFIGTEHLLLGIARENRGVASRVLLDFDVDAEKIRTAVIRMLGGQAARGRERSLPRQEGFSDPAVFEMFDEDLGRSFPLRFRFRLVEGWILFGVSLGIGVLIGWAIWGL
jgi:ATP-dependent Clp protease ATP-binding subunit ClpC